MNLVESYHAYDETKFDKFEFTNSRVDETEFTNCTFTQCDFHETNFFFCRFNECEFIECNLNLITLKDCTFREVKFAESKLVGVNWLAADWPKFGPKTPISFKKCQLDYSTFIGLTLPKLKLVECSLKDVEFSDANLSEADFSDSILTKSRFNNTNLSGANFEDARDYSIDITKNIIKKARFSLPEAYSLLHNIEDLILKE